MRQGRTLIAAGLPLLAVRAATIAWAPAGAAAGTSPADGPAHDGGWQSRAPLPVAQGGLATATVNGQILAIGGFSSNFQAALNVVQAYNPSANSWQTLAPLPTARGDLAAAAADGQVYAIGGLDTAENPVPTVEFFRPASNTWATGTPLPIPLGGAAAAALGDKIYVFGGDDTSAAVASAVIASVEVYDLRTSTWSQAAPMPTARGLLRVAVSGGQIYAIGGADSNGTPLDKVEVYNPSANSWREASPMSVPRKGAGVATTADGRIVAVGGCCTAAGGIYTTAEIYSPPANRWYPFPGLPIPRAGLVAAPGPNGLIFAIAGFQDTPQNTTASHLLDAIRVQ
jgi:N-acetylneuraminic acid mutarotase